MKYQKLTIGMIFLGVLVVIALVAPPLPAQRGISKADLAQTKGGLNPGELDKLEGKDLFKKVDGKKGKSCKSCHTKHGMGKSLRGKAATYPKFIAKTKKVQSLQTMINFCRVNAMGASKYPLKKGKMMQMVTYIKSLSNGKRVNIKISTPEEKAAYKLGKKVFNQRRGQRNLSCAICHVKEAKKYLRMQILKKLKGASSHWPGYRTKKGKTFTIERRFQQCMKNARMHILKIGSPAMIGLELYVTKLANGKKIKVPGMVR
ncbi:MAG: SoxAX cytochrome complex subunit A [bacterium]|nr:MAG: SoxAX cytochrome complex subunit A [bacterium]